MSFDPWNRSLKIWESIETSIPKMRAHLGVWGFIPLTLSHSPGSMKCDSQASHLVRTFISPYFSCELKAKVATHNLYIFLKYFYVIFFLGHVGL
jgi:hypothetical protein